MLLKYFSPSFRNVLYREVIEEKTTEHGIILPKKGFSMTTHADMFENEKEHKVETPGDLIVVKVGKDCTEVKPGDKIILIDGIRPMKLEFDGEDEPLYSVYEQQIAGYERVE